MKRSMARIAIAAAGSVGIFLVVRKKATLRRGMNRRAKPTTISSVITVGKPKDELYRKWRDPEVMSEVFGGILQISGAGEGRIRVRARLPGGHAASWMSKVVQQQDGSSLRWRTDADAAVPYDMYLEFRDARPAEWGTEVTLGVSPLSHGSVAEGILEISKSMDEAVLMKVLRRFKALIESGEIPTLSHNPAGRPRALAAA